MPRESSTEAPHSTAVVGEIRTARYEPFGFMQREPLGFMQRGQLEFLRMGILNAIQLRRGYGRFDEKPEKSAAEVIQHYYETQIRPLSARRPHGPTSATNLHTIVSVAKQSGKGATGKAKRATGSGGGNRTCDRQHRGSRAKGRGTRTGR